MTIEIKKMTFNYKKYYKEIKNRFILTFLSWIICLYVSYCYKDVILFGLIDSSNSFSEFNDKPSFIFTNVTEVFYVYFELIIFTSGQLGFFILLYQSFMFFSLGLYKSEFKKLMLLSKTFLVTWGFSVVFLLTFVIPFSWKFFLSFQGNDQAVSIFFEAKLSEYLNYLTNLYYVCLINCQFLAALVLGLTILSKKLKETKVFRKLFYFVFVVFSTIMTPPDILSQIFICGILIVSYELLTFFKEVTN